MGLHNVGFYVVVGLEAVLKTRAFAEKTERLSGLTRAFGNSYLWKVGYARIER